MLPAQTALLTFAPHAVKMKKAHGSGARKGIAYAPAIGPPQETSLPSDERTALCMKYKERGAMRLDTIVYTVRQIDGDYARLVDGKGAELLMARALLPQEIDEGSRIIYEDYQYSMEP